MKDQNKIVKDCLLNDEPVIALRGRDRCVIPALIAYYNHCYNNGCSDEFLCDLKDLIDDFNAYQAENINSLKLPD